MGEREREVQAAVLQLLQLRGYFRKVHTTAIPDAARPGGFRKNPSKGISDLVGVYRAPCPCCGWTVGRFLAVEVKRAPRSVMSRQQQEYQELVRQAGGLAVRVDNPLELEPLIHAQLEEERQGTGVERQRRVFHQLVDKVALGMGVAPNGPDVMDAERALSKLRRFLRARP